MGGMASVFESFFRDPHLQFVFKFCFSVDLPSFVCREMKMDGWMVSSSRDVLQAHS